MVSKTLVFLEDDLDGSEGAQTVSFAFGGTAYEIDLSEKNAAKLKKALDVYIKAGRRTGRAGRRTDRSSATGIDNAAVRAWAASNKIEVNARGRIPAGVVERYRAAGY